MWMQRSAERGMIFLSERALIASTSMAAAGRQRKKKYVALFRGASHIPFTARFSLYVGGDARKCSCAQCMSEKYPNMR